MKAGRFMIIISFLTGLLIIFGDRGLIDNFRMKERLISLRRANSDLAKENGDLKRAISLLQDDLSSVEMVAKSELGMVKRGTVVFQFDN